MASAGKNCNASQFYFTLRDELDYLDGKHTVFGVVEEQEGLETLAKINEAFVDDKGRPLKNIRIKHTYILDDPFSDPAQLAEFIPEKSPEGKPEDETAEERLEDNWVPMEDTLGAAELEETLRAKEAHTNAAILESIGDIPDADIRPPENVLFVCKLNPVTQDEDLHTIFSRFGNVVSADIIRDFKTGDSLCYAFIEFETQEACELAYIKMDNTLIDDRRIHVDFSQSVSKLWSQYRHGKRSQNKDNGCFKCGSTNHIAKNCNQESGSKPEASKYVLKEANAQRGGGCQSYEMVFDRDDKGGTESSGDETQTKQKKLKADDHNYEDLKQKGYSHGGPDSRSYKHRNDYANREYRQDVERHSSRMSEEYHRNREMKSMDVDLRKKDHQTFQRGRYEENGKKKYHDSSTEHGNVSKEKDVDRHGDKEPWKRHESSRYTRDNVEYRKPGSSDRHREDGSRQGENLDKYSSRSGRNDKGYGKRDERRDERGRHERRHREEKRR